MSKYKKLLFALLTSSLAVGWSLKNHTEKEETES